MQSTRSSPAKRRKKAKGRKKTGNWGGKRKGAGRKHVLALSDRREIASEYYKLTHEESLRREDAIRKLATSYGITPRMVERCLAEFRPQVRRNKEIFRYATEGMNQIGRLPEREIEVKKLKPGVYDDDMGTLRLVLDDESNRKWAFRFLWRKSTYREKVLGDSKKMPLAEARSAVKKESRKLVRGEHPIEGFRENPVLQSVAHLLSDKWK